MVKIGDRVKVVGYRGFLEDYDSKGKEGIVTQVQDGNIAIETDSGYKRYGDERDVEVIVAAPPKKIQQDGYEYELVGPVKPEWLVNGTWVVEKATGVLYRIIVASGRFICVDKTGLGERKDLDYITSNFRPHTASDWKWGDWAMYDGKRVFVVCPELDLNHAMISGEGFPDGLKYVSLDELTPTFLTHTTGS